MIAICSRITARHPREFRRFGRGSIAGRDQDHAHGHERQPEPGGQRRERIEQQHRDQRERPNAAVAGVARASRAVAKQREHEPGALRGHRESGQQRVRAGGARGLTTTRRVRGRRVSSTAAHPAAGATRTAPPKATSANIVTCSPEIATRCVVPVALNTRHWSALTRSVRPTASAVEQRGRVRIGHLRRRCVPPRARAACRPRCPRAPGAC